MHYTRVSYEKISYRHKDNFRRPKIYSVSKIVSNTVFQTLFQTPYIWGLRKLSLWRRPMNLAAGGVFCQKTPEANRHHPVDDVVLLPLPFSSFFLYASCFPTFFDFFACIVSLSASTVSRSWMEIFDVFSACLDRVRASHPMPLKVECCWLSIGWNLRLEVLYSYYWSWKSELHLRSFRWLGWVPFPTRSPCQPLLQTRRLSQ